MNGTWEEPMLPRRYRVQRTLRETKDVFTVQIAPVDGNSIGEWEPGQFNMLYDFGVGEVPISIAGSTATGVTHTIRAVGSVTRAMAGWKRGVELGVRGPFGSAWPLSQAMDKDVLFIAGGIGLAPLWGALSHVLQRRARYGRIGLLYGARTPADLIYRKSLDELGGRNDIHVGVTVDRAGTEWCGHVGVVHELIRYASFDPANTVVFLCGPEVMMRFTARELLSRRVVGGNIYLSMERNMKCAIGLCGHCQFGPEFICKDGPVFPYERVSRWLTLAEL